MRDSTLDCDPACGADGVKPYEHEHSIGTHRSEGLGGSKIEQIGLDQVEHRLFSRRIAECRVGPTDDLDDLPRHHYSRSPAASRAFTRSR